MDEVYIELFNKVKESNFLTFADISSVVYQTVNSYFGENGTAKRTEMENGIVYDSA